MKNKKRKRWHFTTLLAASILLFMLFLATGAVKETENGIVLRIPAFIYDEDPDFTASVPDLPPAAYETLPYVSPTIAETAQDQPGSDAKGQDTDPDFRESGSETAGTPVPSEQPVPSFSYPSMYTADTSYFNDALFIGDSRTVGLSEYGNLGDAEILADSGMNVHKIFDKTFNTRSGRKKSLNEILSSRKYGKIYIMLGINELGYDFEYTLAKYTELVNMISAKKPEAVIFIEANLHVTNDAENLPSYISNDNIDRFNHAIAQIADGRRFFYIDVNEIFDDADGNLSKEYTVDNSHVLGRYYADWAEWILKHAV